MWSRCGSSWRRYGAARAAGLVQLQLRIAELCLFNIPVLRFLWVARSAEMSLDRKKTQRVAFILLPACLPAPSLPACPALHDGTAAPAAYNSAPHSLAPSLLACQALFDHIPVGVGSQGIIPTTAKDLEEALEMGMDWSLREVRGH